MELDSEEGRCYASGIRVEEGDIEGELPARKKAKANNSLTRTQSECKCRLQDRQRVLSQKCPWNGLNKREVSKNYEKRMREKMEMMDNMLTTTSSAVHMEEIVHPTRTCMAPKPYRICCNMVTTEKIVHSTSKYMAPNPNWMRCDMEFSV
jgi:hypothetical protein